ncbi:MAG: histidine kinase [Saprospiraceae bacterium]|nr:histidine kinase [Saprospiraceae bacterium]
MTIPVPPRYQYIGFLSSMPVICFFLSYILYDKRVFTDWEIWAAAFPLLYAIGYVSWRTHYIYDHFIHSKFPSLDETRKRVLYIIPINLFVMTPSVLFIFFIFDYFNILGYQIQENDLLYGYLAGLGVNIVFESLWEVIYIIDKYKESAAEAALIEQMQLRQEFDRLKEKVNPHFLFNSFNTLSSLIVTDKDLAEKFLDELSKVYRYLLRNNETGMSTLGQEMKFIDSYATLLTTRYGEGFRLIRKIEPSKLEKEIPTLSLQLLVENAVKHNVVSKEKPLEVIIETTADGYLKVSNALHPKTRAVVDSTGIGLSNIREKYKLLQREDVEVGVVDHYFVVKIPIL